MADDFLQLSAQDRRDALGVAADRSGRPTHLLEKDVWVVWALATLYAAPLGEHTDKGQTKETWIYDLRSGAPKFGKRTALTVDYFADFIDRFGMWPTDNEPRHQDIQSDRFRRFSREDFSANGDNLDIRWLTDEESFDELQPLRPEEISGLILAELRAAIADVEELHAQFDHSAEQ